MNGIYPLVMRVTGSEDNIFRSVICLGGEGLHPLMKTNKKEDIYRTHTWSGWWFGTFFPYIGNVIIPGDSYFSGG